MNNALLRDKDINKFTITIMAEGVNSLPQFNGRVGKEDTKQMLIVIFHLNESGVIQQVEESGAGGQI